MSHERFIRRVDQIQALSSPVRHEIADCLAAGGPMSVAELARELGRTPQSLYFHVQRLLDVGLIEVAGERELHRHVETLYVVSRELRIRYDLDDPDSRDAVCTMVASMLRVAAKDFEAGLELDGARVTGDVRNLWAARIVAWVSPEELERVNALLNSLVDLMSTRRDETRTERVALQWSLSPAPATAEAETRSVRRDHSAHHSGSTVRRRKRPSSVDLQ